MTVTYTLTDHCCRACLGRVLQAVDGSHHRCAECGATAVGTVHHLCACGTRLKTGRSAGLCCQRNPDPPTPEAPAEIVVMCVGPVGASAMPCEIKLRDGGGGLLAGLESLSCRV